MTTVFSFPFDRTRYFLVSPGPADVVVLIVIPTSKPSAGKRTWSAFWTIEAASASSADTGVSSAFPAAGQTKATASGNHRASATQADSFAREVKSL